MSKPNSREVHEVTFISYPKLLFVWPLIVLGFLFWPLAGIGADDPDRQAGVLEALGWFYIVAAILVILTLGVDVNRNQAIFWMVLIGLVWILGLWLRDAKQILIVNNLYSWFADLNVRYDRAFGLVISVFLSVPYAVMLVYAWVNDRWRITHNEFEHYSMGRMDDSLGRGAKSVRTTFPDIFEMLLGMAGTLIVFNATGTKVLRRIEHVMFLPLVRKRLNRILESTAITAAMSEAEEDDDDEDP